MTLGEKFRAILLLQEDGLTPEWPYAKIEVRRNYNSGTEVVAFLLTAGDVRRIVDALEKRK